jgi:hypothetical protein
MFFKIESTDAANPSQFAAHQFWTSININGQNNLSLSVRRDLFLFMFIQQPRIGEAGRLFIYSLTLLINMRKEEFITGARNLFFAKGEFNQAAASLCK